MRRYFQQQHELFEAGTVSPLPIIGGGDLNIWTFVHDAAGWASRHDCELSAEDGKLRVVSSGNDPFFGVSVAGPAGSYRLFIKAQFGVSGKGQLFWTTEKDLVEAPERSVSFDLLAGQWKTYEVPLTFDAPPTSLRIDPGAEPGTSLIESIRLSYGSFDTQRDERLDPAELAAWTLVARALLNLDETITKP